MTKQKEPESFTIKDGWVYIWVPKLKKSVVVGKIENGKYVWDGADESKHTINIEGKRCWGIDRGLLDKHLLPRKMTIEICGSVGDIYSIIAEEAEGQGIVRKIGGYGEQYYIPMDCFLFNGKPFNEA
jgi:hypothetical protein